MANPEHLAALKQGSSAWNRWRTENPNVLPDLGGSHLGEARLSGANLAGADFRLAYFGRADLSGADLTGAELSEASIRHGYFAHTILHSARLVGTDLRQADFQGARLIAADLTGAYLERANLSGADLEGANLTGSDLRLAVAVDANFRNSTLTACQIYGVSAWNVNLEGADQRDLVITPPGETAVTTDNLAVAQFLYLLLNNRAIRDVIETVGTKAILILGRFDAQRKPVLDAIRNEVRRAGLIPILFDFAGPRNRDITETVATLAHLARAVIADLSGARSIPQELSAIVPNLPSVPIQPILAASDSVYGMFEHFHRYSWVRPVFCYQGEQELLIWLRDKLLELGDARRSGRNAQD